MLCVCLVLIENLIGGECGLLFCVLHNIERKDFYLYYFFFFFQAEDGIRDLVRSRGLGDVYKRQWLHITPDEVLRLMDANDSRWETMVPKYVSKRIKTLKIFGYKGEDPE